MKAGLVGKSVQTQVFKCDQGGVISYSDSPCKAASSKSQTLDLKLGESTKLQQNQSFAITHYDVRGSTAEELDRSLASNGPKGYHGLATWKVAYTFKMQKIDSKCKIAELNLKHDGVVLMPRWVDAALAPRDLVRRWELTYASLKRHEDGHIAHGTEFITRVRSALLSIPSLACDQLEGHVKRVFDDLHKIYSERDAEYDQRTNHGANQDTRAM